jgi:hypothetical protein
LRAWATGEVGSEVCQIVTVSRKWRTLSPLVPVLNCHLDQAIRGWHHRFEPGRPPDTNRADPLKEDFPDVFMPVRRLRRRRPYRGAARLITTCSGRNVLSGTVLTPPLSNRTWHTTDSRLTRLRTVPWMFPCHITRCPDTSFISPYYTPSLIRFPFNELVSDEGSSGTIRRCEQWISSAVA